MGDSILNPTKVTSRVIQGSVIGPLYFILFINKINRTIISTTKTYADDRKIYRKCISSQDVATLQKENDTLTENLQSLCLNFNSSKTKVLWIGKKNTASVALANNE